MEQTRTSTQGRWRAYFARWETRLCEGRERGCRRCGGCIAKCGSRFRGFCSGAERSRCSRRERLRRLATRRMWRRRESLNEGSAQVGEKGEIQKSASELRILTALGRLTIPVGNRSDALTFQRANVLIAKNIRSLPAA